MTTPAPVKPEHVAAAQDAITRAGRELRDVEPFVAQALADAEAHGRADLEARCQQARADALREAAGLAARGRDQVRDGVPSGGPVAVFAALAAKLESLATSPAPAPARVAPVDDARRLLGELVAKYDAMVAAEHHADIDNALHRLELQYDDAPISHPIPQALHRRSTEAQPRPT